MSQADVGLSREELRRYSRHLVMPEVGLSGQKKIRAARILCVGAGGLGSPLSIYLAAAGVGTLGIVDFDVVDESNLHRQILYGTGDVGKSKLRAAAAHIEAINPNVRLVPFETRLTSENALEILRDFDIVVDGTDNFPTRYLVNDACVMLAKPNVYASIFRFDGQASVFGTRDGPCYRCLYPEPPPAGLVPSCAEGGVLGILPGLLGVIQAAETLKLVLGVGSPLIGRLLLVDALAMNFREVRLRKDPACVVCGPSPSVTRLIDYESFCGSTRPGEPEAHTGSDSEISAEDLRAKIDAADDFVLVDVREPHELEIAALPRAINIPLGTLPEKLNRLCAADDIVVFCKVGGRSARAADLLRSSGFRNVHSLAGGIDRWAREIDPTMARY